MKSSPYVQSSIRINSEKIKELNIAKNIKFLEENIEESFMALTLLGMTPDKSRNNKWNSQFVNCVCFLRQGLIM
jgi:hypothetical protein